MSCRAGAGSPVKPLPDARAAVAEVANALQVLALTIDASRRNPLDQWHRAEDISTLARRVLTSAETLVAVLCDKHSTT